DALLAEVRARYSVRLVSPYPPEWYRTLDRRVGLGSTFPDSEVLFCQLAQLGRLLPDVFFWALGKAGKTIEETLWVADQPAMTSAAVRLGLNAIIFADSRRLRRELVLRSLLPAAA